MSRRPEVARIGRWIPGRVIVVPGARSASITLVFEVKPPTAATGNIRAARIDNRSTEETLQERDIWLPPAFWQRTSCCQDVFQGVSRVVRQPLEERRKSLARR